MSPPHLNISILAFEGARSFLLSIPFAVFRSAQALAPAAGIAVRAFAAKPGRIHLDAADSLELDVTHGPEILATTELVVVPSWYGVAHPAPRALTDAIRRAHARGAQVAGLCLGVFVVAQSGLLDGRRAAVMHEFSREFSRQFPHTRVAVDATCIRDGRVVTSAGRAAAMECCLALLKAACGDALANRVTAHLNHDARQRGLSGGDIPLQESLRADDQRVLQLIEWLQLHTQEQTTVDALADRVHMTARTFTRRFQTLTGTTPNAWLLRARLERAETLLRQSTLTIDAIARAVGFRTTAALRKQFRNTVGTSPTAFRAAGIADPDTTGEANPPGVAPHH